MNFKIKILKPPAKIYEIGHLPTKGILVIFFFHKTAKYICLHLFAKVVYYYK